MTDRHLDLLDLDAHRAGESLGAAARAHLAWCAECQRAVAELQALAAELAALPPPAAIPARRDAAIRELAARRAAIARRAHARRARLAPAARWAAAAALLVVIGAVLLRAAPPEMQRAGVPAARPTLTVAQADLNGDGRVDVLDAYALARAVTRGTPRLGDADRHDVDLILAMAVSLDRAPEEP